MMNSGKTATSYLAFFLLFLFALAAYQFSVTDHLAGFSDDSATYLIMAGNLSPYTQVPESHQLSYQYHHLPPGYPLVTALSGIAHNIKALHMLAVFELTLVLLIFAVFSRSVLPENIFLIPVFLFASSPGLWMEMLRLTSEHQYLLLSLVSILMIYRYQASRSLATLILAGLFIGMAILTRTIGIALLLTLLIHTYSIDRKHYLLKASLITIVALSPALVWAQIAPEINHSYLADMINIYTKEGGFTASATIIYGNIKALLHGWIQNIALWPEAINQLHYYIALLFAAPVILGISTRIRTPETIYLLIYIGILVIWPYPDDMSRFLYPILPFILLNLVSGIEWLSKGARMHYLKHFLILIFILAVLMPSHIKAYERYNLGKNLFGNNVTHIPELYTLPSKNDAITTSLVWHKTAEFMKSLKPVSAGYGTTLTIKPQFLTFYSDIKAKKIPILEPGQEQQYLRYILESDADHILITTIPVSLDKTVDVLALLSRAANVRFSLSAQYQKDEENIIIIMDIERTSMQKGLQYN